MVDLPWFYAYPTPQQSSKLVFTGWTTKCLDSISFYDVETSHSILKNPPFLPMVADSAIIGFQTQWV